MHERNLGNQTGVSYLFPIVWENDDTSEVTSLYDYNGKLYACGIFKSNTASAYNSYGGDAFVMRMDTNSKVEIFKILSSSNSGYTTDAVGCQKDGTWHSNQLFQTDTANNLSILSMSRMFLPDLGHNYTYGASFPIGTYLGSYYSVNAKVAFLTQTSNYINVISVPCTECSACMFTVQTSGGYIYHTRRLIDSTSSTFLTSSFISVTSTGTTTWNFYQYDPSNCNMQYLKYISASIYTLTSDSNIPACASTIDSKGVCIAEDNNGGSLRTLLFKFSPFAATPFYLYAFTSQGIPLSVYNSPNGIYILFKYVYSYTDVILVLVPNDLSGVTGGSYMTYTTVNRGLIAYANSSPYVFVSARNVGITQTSFCKAAGNKVIDGTVDMDNACFYWIDKTIGGWTGVASNFYTGTASDYITLVQSSVTRNDISSGYAETDVTSLRTVYLSNDGLRSSLTTGLTCVHQAPYITTALDSNYVVYATDSPLVFTLDMSSQIQGVPYNFTVLYQNGTTFSQSSIWYNVDYSNFDSSHRVVITFDIAASGTFYNVSDNYPLNFQIQTLEPSYRATQANLLYVNRKNDPCLTTSIANQSIRVGEYIEIALSIQTNKTLTNSTGGIYIDCFFQNGTAFSGCYSKSLSDLGTIVLYTEDNTLGSTAPILTVSLWYESTSPRKYNFTVTYRANTKPTFSSTPTSIQIVCCADQTYTLPSATDAEGDTLYYRITIPTLPFTLTCSDPSTRVLSISGLAVNLETTYSGFSFDVCENSNFMYCTTLSFSIDVINTVPTPTFTAADKTITPYINSTLTFPCPWFSDTQGDLMAISYTISPALSVMSIDTANCQFLFSGLNNSFAGTYSLTVTAYDPASTITNHGLFSLTLTIQANVGPSPTAVISDRTIIAGRTTNYTWPSYTDPDNEVLTFTYTVLPAASFISFNPAIRNFTLTPANPGDVGNYTCTLSCTDSHPDTVVSTQTFKFIIVENLPPTTTSITFSNNTFLAYYYINIDYNESLFSDPNGDTVYFSITNPMSTSWCYRHNGYLILAKGTPTNADVGNYTIELKAYDIYGAFNIYTFWVNIMTNHAPITTQGTSLTFTIYCLQTFTMNLADYFSEPDNEALTYSLTSTINAGWVTVNNATHTLSGAPPNTAATATFYINTHDPNYTSCSIYMTIYMLYNNGPYLSTGFSSLYCYEGVHCTINFSSYFNDTEGDAISYSGSSISPSISEFSYSVTTGIMDFVPLYSSIRSYYVVTVYARDIYYPTTPHIYKTFALYVYANRRPVNNTYISNQSSVAGFDYSYTFSSSLFSDPDGEPITYSYGTSPGNSWLSFNSATFTLSGKPIPNGDAVAYTVYIYADDNNTYSATASTHFTLTITANKIPVIDQGLPTPAPNPYVYYQFSYTIPANAFKDPEGDPITITPTLIPNNFTITYDSTNRIVTGTQTDNTKYGSYTLRLSVTDNWAVSALVVNKAFTYKQNKPPVVNTTPSSPSCIIAHYQLSYSIPLSYFSEPESETINYSFTTNETSTMSDWISMTQNSTHLIFSGTPTNLQAANFNVTLQLSDGHPGVTTTTRNFIICVNQNQSPTMPGTATTIQNGQVGFNWSYNYSKSWNSDPESETLTFSCSSNDTYSWISCSENATHVIFQGFPNNNAYAGNYNITVLTSDPYTDVSKYNWTSSFTITVNNPPTIGTMANKSLQAPDGLSWSYGSTLTSDPEGLSYTKSLEVDGSTTIPSWLVYNLANFDFALISSSNNISGDHNITVIVADPYNPSVKKNFTLSIIYNQAPYKLMQIPNYGIVNFNLLTVAFPSITTLFNDPENRGLTAKLTQGDGDPLPSFLTYNSLTNTLSGTPLDINIGDWPILYTAVDDENNSASISFKITVKPCYYKCINCTTDDYNTCLSCKYGYYLQFNQCKETCDGKYFANPLTSTCDQCHSYCRKCKDATQFDCQSCNAPYFYYENSCLEVCPDGYYGDTSTYTCQKCNEACTKCFGASTKECTACNNTLLYIHSGSSDCVLATCIRGYYLNTTDLNCYQCITGCNVCPNSTYCNQCNPIYKMQTSGSCTYCELITGYKINEFGVCKEVCGDGLNLGDYQCDDGNLINGDGCSSSCNIENGYTCVGTKCWEIIKPTGSIVSVSTTNLFTIQFSEEVIFTNYSFFESNLRTNINGPSSPYNYQYTIYDPKLLLKENKNFKQMQIQVSNILTSIFGSGIEKFEVWFIDKSALKDMNNNNFSDSKIVGNMRPYEYVSTSTKQAAQSGGSSMQYTILSMFSINMLLKIAIKSSAATMWSLIHVLQIFRYILLINITMPSIISVLIKYLGVVVGDIDEVQNMVPDIFNTYIVNSTELNQNVTIYPKFSDNGYNSPFLTDSYGRQIVTWTSVIVFGLPAIYILMKILKSWTWVNTKIQGIWSSFFFNNPMRAFTEVFIEIAFCFFLNTLNIQFTTRSGIITSLLMLIIGAAVITWSFILLNLICFNPKIVRTKEFRSKYGTAIEDISTKKTLFQKAYYPLFIFERVVLTAIVVIMYDYTQLQLFAISIMQISVISYLIAFKPFKEDLMNIIVCTDEFTIIVGLVIIYLMYINESDNGMMLNLSYSIFGILIISIIKNISIALYNSCTRLYRKLRRKVHKKIKYKQMMKERIMKEDQERKTKELQEKDDEDMLINGPRIGRKGIFKESKIENNSDLNDFQDLNSGGSMIQIDNQTYKTLSRNFLNKNQASSGISNKLTSNLNKNRSSISKNNDLKSLNRSLRSYNATVTQSLQPIPECTNEE